MKRVFTLVLALLMTGMLFGCTAEPAEPTTQPPEPAITEAPTTAPTEIPTEAPTEEPTEAPTVPPTETQAPTEPPLPYLQKISSPDQAIYHGPSYDSGLAGTVEIAGTYTIVEEARDAEGNLWGKLKSGAGWVNLTQIREYLENPPLLTAAYADDTLLSGGHYHHYVQPLLDEYGVAIVFRAGQTLWDISFFTLNLSESLEMGELLTTLPELTPDMPFVAEIMFPGDMTMFGIRFTDSLGQVHSYCISISGRDGSVVLSSLELED